MKNKFANTKKDLFSYGWRVDGVIKPEDSTGVQLLYQLGKMP